MEATQPTLDLNSLPSPQTLWAKLNSNWLTGYRDRDPKINQQWRNNVETRQCQLAQYKPQSNRIRRNPPRPLLLINEPDPLDFLASFWAALLSDWDIALANPNWGDREQSSALQTLKPTLIWPASSLPHSPTSPLPHSPTPKILIPTGGTTGTLKFAHHTWQTLLTATTGFCQTFPAPINTYCVLPVYHVSGLMQMLRAWLSQAQVIISPFKSLETAAPLIDRPTDWYISLVPTQLARLMQAGKNRWLSQFQAVFLGGAPAWPALLDRAIEQSIPICLSYGMTETAAMVTALRPSEFLRGFSQSSGTVLPHVNLTIESANIAKAESNIVGQIVIHSPSVALGYYGQSNDRLGSVFSHQSFRTDDLGYLSPMGQLHVTGRASNKIISGGENIFPTEVEAALRSTGQVKDVYVFAQPDPEWGEAVTAAFVPVHSEVTVSSLKAALSTYSGAMLSRYKHPKRWIALSHIPRNAQGKLITSALKTQIANQSRSQAPEAMNSDADRSS